MKRMRWLAISALGIVLAAGVHAQVPESQRTLVTDPNLLESMGFPRDATNVYRAKNLDRIPSETPDDWGLDTHFTAVTPYDFTAQANSDDWVISGSEFDSGFSCVCFASAGIQLPTGVRIDAVRWWAHDSNATDDLTIRIFEVCHPPFGAGDPVLTVVADGETSGSGGQQSGVLGGGGHTVNNRDCYYEAWMFGVDFTMALNKLRVQWSRQVSPPPAEATFADVPTDHPFFQHIEALAASGITAGCGGGNFCPGAPLTRGQMAVFLSVALGLHFP